MPVVNPTQPELTGTETERGPGGGRGGGREVNVISLWGAGENWLKMVNIPAKPVWKMCLSWGHIRCVLCISFWCYFYGPFWLCITWTSCGLFCFVFFPWYRLRMGLYSSLANWVELVVLMLHGGMHPHRSVVPMFLNPVARQPRHGASGGRQGRGEHAVVGLAISSSMLFYRRGLPQARHQVNRLGATFLEPSTVIHIVHRLVNEYLCFFVERLKFVWWV